MKYELNLCYVKESRPPLWSSGQSSSLQIGNVLCLFVLHALKPMYNECGVNKIILYRVTLTKVRLLLQIYSLVAAEKTRTTLCSVVEWGSRSFTSLTLYSNFLESASNILHFISNYSSNTAQL
jgi:hypothetical protein